MPELVTNHMLRKQLAKMSRETRNGVTGISTNTASSEADELAPLFMTEKKINRLQGDEFIATDNTRGKLYYPLPGVKWKCRGAVGPNGVVTLEQELTGLFVSDGSKSYLLGVWGDTKEFEVLLKIGDNEIRLNDLFVNMKSNMFVVNGLEAELGGNTE